MSGDTHIAMRPTDPREAPGPVRALAGETDARLPVQALAAKGQLLNARPTVVAQRALAGKLSGAQPRAKLTQPRLVSPRDAAVQRVITITGGGENFEHIVAEFCRFAKNQGGAAWEMLHWFWHGKNNTLEVHSVSELDSLGYTDCRIAGQEAHTLTNKQWSELPRDAPVRITVSVRNDKGHVAHNDAKQYYTILHEMMVHAHPFYLKMKKVRAGTGPKSKAEAGYHGGPDAMSAHAEHQHLLHKTNQPFYALYHHMVSTLMKGLFGKNLPETLRGMSLGEFTQTHDHDITVQYTEEANARYKAAHRSILRIFEGLKQAQQGKLSKDKMAALYRGYIEQLKELEKRLLKVWDAYHKAYTVHTSDYRPPDYREPEIPPEGHGGISRDVLAQLPYFNPDMWSEKELKLMADKVREVADVHGKVGGYIKQFTAAIEQLK